MFGTSRKIFADPAGRVPPTPAVGHRDHHGLTVPGVSERQPTRAGHQACDDVEDPELHEVRVS